MYNFELNYSYLNQYISLILLIFLVLLTSIEKTFVRAAFDILIFTIYMPVAVMLTIQGTSIFYAIYPFISIVIIFVTWLFLKNIKLNIYSGYSVLTYDQFTKLVSIVYLLPLFVLIISNYQVLFNNIILTYENTYDIRAEVTANGMLGYYLNWYNFLFFPIFLDITRKRFKYFYLFIAFIGAWFIMNKYAVKIIFFNYFLLFIFSVTFLKFQKYVNYFVHIFFFILFSLSFILDKLYLAVLDRFFYIIGINSLYYFDYYGKNDLRFFEGSKLDLGISKTGKVQGFIIDDNYYQGLGVNQSAGFLPTIYSDIGLFGVMIGSFLIGLIMKILYSYVEISPLYSFLLIIAFAFMLMNFSLNMIPLSTGLIVVVISKMIIRSRSYE